MPSVAVPATRLREVRSGLADMLRPVAALQSELVRSWPIDIDGSDARRRVRAGRPAFDAVAMLQRAGDLSRPFRRATQAFERAGLATHESAAAARQHGTDMLFALSASWIAGEPLPKHEPRRLAQRAAAVVAGSVLARVAGAVRTALRAAPPDRTCCPACGSAPEFSLATARGRRLTCARCDIAWVTTRIGCLGCSAHDEPMLVRIPSRDLGYDLLVCHGCGRYLKERTRRGTANLLVERALTAQLDAAAELRGFRL